MIGNRVSLEELEREHIMRIIEIADSMDEAAQILGIDPATLYRKRKRYADRLPSPNQRPPLQPPPRRRLKPHASIRPIMLRTRLMLGLICLLIIVLAMGLYSINQCSELGKRIQKISRDNDQSAATSAR